MAERIVSPGVFTNEVDQSFLAPGVAQIGAAVVGPTVKGPALVPTQIRSFGEYESMFGPHSRDSYVPFLVNEYLRNGGNVITVTRLLYEDGYSLSNGLLAVVATSGSTTPSSFSSGSVTFNHVPSGSLFPGGSDEVTIGGVDFTFVSESAGLVNSSTQIFVEFPNASGATTTTTVAANLKDAINNNTSLHGLDITATNSTNILILSGSSAGVLNLTIATGSGGDTTSTVANFAIPVNVQGGTAAVGGTNTITHVLHPTQPVTTDGATNLFEDSVLNDGGSGSFEIKISGSYVAGSDNAIGYSGAFLVAEGASISGSIVSTSNTHLNKVFGQSAKSVDHPVFVQYGNKNASTLFNNLGDVTLSLSKVASFALSQDFQTAATPFITSQKIGTTTKNLFKVHSLSHGTSVNHEVKIGIENVKLAAEVADLNGYGTFDIVVRRVNNTNISNSPYGQIDDTDSNPVILEAFRNLNLDPTSVRYISRVIGDRFQTITDAGDLLVNGDYPNLSKFIRVSVDTGVTNGTNDKTLIPFGFRSLQSPIPDVGGVNLTAAAYLTSQTPAGSSHNLVNYHGFDFSNLNNLNYLAPIPTSNASTGSNSDFYLGDVTQDAAASFPTLLTAYSGSLQDAIDAGTFTTKVSTSTRKFILPMQGAFDGAKPNLKKYSGTNITSANTFGHNCSSATSTGTKAYNKAFTLLENTDFYDINMLLTPGIIDSLHSSVTTKARNLVDDAINFLTVINNRRTFTRSKALGLACSVF